MKKIFFIISISIFYSCAERIYTSASYGSLKSFTEKPIYKEENTSAVYVSATISNANITHSKTNDISDKKQHFSLNIHKAFSRKNINFYYGFGTSYGNYKFHELENIIQPGEIKDYYNLNIKSGANFTLSTKKIKFRIIGLELAYHYEFGSYQKKLNQITPNDDIYVINLKSIPSMNIYSEYVFIINPKNHFSIGSYFGNVLFLDKKKYNINNETTFFVGSTFSYTYDKFTLSLVLEKNNAIDNSLNFGFSYKL